MNSSPTFATECRKPRTDLQLLVQTYVNNLDKKINTALKSQNTVINMKKRQLVQQIELIKERKEKETQKVSKMQEYFANYCQSVLNEDIQKWKNNDRFYKELFKMYEKRIKLTESQNAALKQKINRLTAEVKIGLRQLRKKQISCNKKVPHSVISYSNDDRSETENNGSQILARQNQTEISRNCPSNSTRIKTQVSLPSIPRNPQNLSKVSSKYKIFKICNQSVSSLKRERMTTEPVMKKPTNSTNDNMERSQHSYMNPIHTVKKTYDSPLKLLEELLDWYRTDRKGSENEEKWFEKLLFNERNYKKLKLFLKANSGQRTMRLTSEC